MNQLLLISLYTLLLSSNNQITKYPKHPKTNP